MPVCVEPIDAEPDRTAASAYPPPTSHNAQPSPRGQLDFGISEDLSACDPVRQTSSAKRRLRVTAKCRPNHHRNHLPSYHPSPPAELFATASCWVHPYLQRPLVQPTLQSHRIASSARSLQRSAAQVLRVGPSTVAHGAEISPMWLIDRRTDVCAQPRVATHNNEYVPPASMRRLFNVASQLKVRIAKPRFAELRVHVSCLQHCTVAWRYTGYRRILRAPGSSCCAAPLCDRGAAAQPQHSGLARCCPKALHCAAHRTALRAAARVGVSQTLL